MAATKSHHTSTGASNRDIVVIGGSAGGVEGLSRIAAGLPEDLPAAVFVALHFPARGTSVLPQILSRAGRLCALHPVDGERIENGTIYVAPPDRHMLFGHRGVIRLVRGPTENGNRPAIDPMFRSAAVAFGPRVVGVVISGNLDDGAAGLQAVKRRGGVAIVQDPSDALFPSMPQSAIQHVHPDHVVSLNEIPALISQIVRERLPATTQAGTVDQAERETAYSAFDLRVLEDPAAHPGHPSPFGCPDCGGVLWQINDGQMTRYRCRVGHGWTSEGLLDKQDATLEIALWSALRALEESIALSEQMAQRIERRGQLTIAKRFRDGADLSKRRADLIRQVLLAGATDKTGTPIAELIEESGGNAD